MPQGRIPGTDVDIGELNTAVRSFLDTFQPEFEPRKRLSEDVSGLARGCEGMDEAHAQLTLLPIAATLCADSPTIVLDS